jgi:uncharacterized protein (DUF4415 family)
MMTTMPPKPAFKRMRWQSGWGLIVYGIGRRSVRVLRSSTMSKMSKRTSIVMPSVAEDKIITAAAKRDPNAQPLTSNQLKAMVPLKTLRGRPKSEKTKQLVSIRYSREVVEYFKSRHFAVVQSQRKPNNWSPSAIAARSLSISNQLAMVGNLEWMRCC